GQHEQQGRRAREAGEVADVLDVGDQHGLAARLRETLPEARQAAGDVHGRKGGLCHCFFPFSRPATASTASVYDRPPNPMIVPVDTGEITDVWRHCSRALGLEMWISTTGPSNMARASCNDQA